MNRHAFTSCELTFNGVPMGGITDISWKQDRSETAAALPSATFSGEITMTLDATSGFLDRFFPRPGASDATLARRVRYGGRKGRSALKRLFAKASPVEISAGDLRIRGRAVFLNDGEMVFQTTKGARR